MGNPKTNKLVIPKDAVFAEMAAWNWGEKLPQSQSSKEFRFSRTPK